MSIVELETQRLVLTSWTDAHIRRLQELRADPGIMANQPQGPQPIDNSDVSFDTQTKGWETKGFGPWAVLDKESGRFIGAIGLSHVGHWADPEVSWLLNTPYWNRGLATEGATAALGFGFEHCNLSRVISVTIPENGASERVMQKLGMSRTDDTICPLRAIPVTVYAITAQEWATTFNRMPSR